MQRAGGASVTNRPLDPMDAHFDYPLFSILIVDHATAQKWIVSVEAEANDCVLLYKTRELAELYIEQAQQADPNAALELPALNNKRDLLDMLQQLPASADHLLWDAPLKP